MTAVRLVQDWEPNTCCHLSECLSVCQSACLPGLCASLQVTGFCSAICRVCWFDSGPCFARACVYVCQSERNQMCKHCSFVCVCLRGSQYGMCVLARICPADWVLVKHFQMLATEIRMWLLKPEKIWLTIRKKKKENAWQAKKKTSFLAEREMSLSIIYIQITRVPPN